MDIRKLQRAIVDGMEDVKAHDIVVFNTEHLSSMFERVIIASGTSNRQTKALASSVRDSVKSRGLPVLSTEGAENGEWIIVDCGAAVAHIMQPAIRDYYNLEEIWGGKPVKMKLDGASAQALPKAEKPAQAHKTSRAFADAEPNAKAKAKAPEKAATRAKSAHPAKYARTVTSTKGGAGRPTTGKAGSAPARPRKPVPGKTAARKTAAAKPTRRPR